MLSRGSTGVPRQCFGTLEQRYNGLGKYEPSIVEGDYDHKINAFVFDLVQVINIARKMADRAARCESSWDGEKHNLLVCKLFASMICLRDATGCEGLFLF